MPVDSPIPELPDDLKESGWSIEKSVVPGRAWYYGNNRNLKRMTRLFRLPLDRQATEELIQAIWAIEERNY